MRYSEVRKAADLLRARGIEPAVYTFPTIKPLDREIIEECACRYDLIVTCEEHNIIGGFGGAVAEVLAGMRRKKAYQIRIGIHDEFAAKVGDQNYLREQYGLSAETISSGIIDALQEC